MMIPFETNSPLADGIDLVVQNISCIRRSFDLPLLNVEQLINPNKTQSLAKEINALHESDTFLDS